MQRHKQILAEEFLYARIWASQGRRAQAPEVWNTTTATIASRPPCWSAAPATQLAADVTNVMASYREVCSPHRPGARGCPGGPDIPMPQGDRDLHGEYHVEILHQT